MSVAIPATSRTSATKHDGDVDRPGRLVHDTWTMARRYMLRNVRLPQLLLFATAQPVMFLVLFTYVFGGAIGSQIPAAANGVYLNFLLPGLLVQIAAFGAGQTALGLTEDLASGAIDRFRSLPMARGAVLAGRTTADLVRSTAVAVLMIGVAFALGFRYQTTLAGFVLGVTIVMVFGFALSWVMAAVGLKVRNPEAAQSAVFLPVFPFVFASGVFVPTSTMPSWLQVFADHQPVTVVAEAARGLMLGQSVLEPGRTVVGQALLAIIWSAAIVAVAAPIAVYLYRRAGR